MAWTRWRRGRNALAAIGFALILSASARAWQQTEQDPAEAEPQGTQVLTQGPIHEAFAEPVLFDPKPGPVVPKTPPAPVKELPPEQKPEGSNVQWIPGYWAWDDGRSDFIWVSGVWRAVPPGRQWIPGYWQDVQGGSQWVPGYWGPADANEVQYLPEPPASLENGPTSPQPSANAVWAPGMWVWQTNQYQWRPGFWVANQPGWMWVPASNSWTPNGYVSNPGFWDYPLASRGMPFAPVYFSQPLYNRPNFMYTPGVGLVTSALMTSLFVRPSYGSYYFGDYYAPSYNQSGIYPWYAFHGSRYGYDPIYAYTAAQNFATNPRWGDELHNVYDYRRAHPEARPPRTFAETRRLAARPAAGTNAVPGAANLQLARPLNQLAANTKDLRFERLDAAQRQQLARQAAQLHEYRAARLRNERATAAGAAAERSSAHARELPRSPIAAAARAEGSRAAPAPPAAPKHPEAARVNRPGTVAPVPARHAPSHEVRPPAPGGAPPRAKAQPPARTVPPPAKAQSPAKAQPPRTTPPPARPGAPQPKGREPNTPRL